MSVDDDADGDGIGGPPLPLEDRLWRHPSELGRPALARRSPTWPVALLAGALGAALCGGALAATGSLSDDEPERVVEKVAVTPVVSSPLVQGEEGVVAMVERLEPSVVELLVRTGAGTMPATAVVWRDDGLLLTSAFEVEGAMEITVVLHDGRRLRGRLVGADPSTDVAVVSVDADDLAVAVLGSSAALRPGATMIAVGPSTDGRGPAVSTGIVSAVDRRVDGADPALHGLIQTDAPIEPGWSGGPLVDSSGAVVGITTGAAGADDASSYATPIDLVRSVADEIVTTGEVQHGWLGIEGVDLTAVEAENTTVPGGAVVREVAAGGPAANAGIAIGDVITDVGGTAVDSSSGLVVVMRDHQPGAEVTVGYWRDGQRFEVTVTVAERP